MKLLLPFKGLESAKSRWSTDEDLRRGLVTKLLLNNIATAQRALGVQQVFLVTPERFEHAEVQIIKTDGGHLNRDLQQARAHFAPDEVVAVLLPDLPSLSEEDILTMKSESIKTQVVICPDHRGVGTNALCLNPGDCLPFLFEGESCQRHLQAARRAGLSVTLLKRPGLANDCDDLPTLRKFSVIP